MIRFETVRTVSDDEFDGDLKVAVRHMINKYLNKPFYKMDTYVENSEFLSCITLRIKTPVGDIRLGFNKDTHELENYNWNQMYNGKNSIDLIDVLSEVDHVIESFLESYENIEGFMSDKFNKRIDKSINNEWG